MTKTEQLLNELIDCRIQRRRLDARVAELRGRLGLDKPARRHLSAEGRANIAAAQRARWAANKKEARQTATPHATALKKWWAAFRAGNGSRPGAKEGSTRVAKPERKKVKWTPAMRRAAAERMRRVTKEMAKKRGAAKAAAA